MSNYQKRIREGIYYEEEIQLIYIEFIEDSKQKKLLDKEYNELLVSELL